ncbi:transcriptional regulator [Clostridium butyricum]|uniref:transcriptional regulator n=1 Tax=Clostridium butyricum TaxID=1492 RepID=UPI002AB1670E|nr:transcriptional regulator [Clostridium butyricum]
MEYKRMTPHEFREKTIRDIEARRKRTEEGRKQAYMHVLENQNRIRRKLSHSRQ